MNRRAFLNPFLMLQTQVKIDAPATTAANLKVESVEITGTTPTRFYMQMGTAPVDTVDTVARKQHDAVLFIDQDGRPKVRLADGRIFAMSQLT